MVYSFDTDIAAIYGVDEAVMIQNFIYWIQKNAANGKHFHDGRFWTYNSIEAFKKLFPFWSAGQLRRVLKSLVEKDVLVTGNFNTSAYDRTTWYAFSDSFLQNQNLHLLKSTNGGAENGRPIPDNNPDINNPNSNDIYPAAGDLFPSDGIVVTRPRRTSEPLCLFENSRFYDYALFSAEFTSQEFKDIDIEYYYHAVADWSSAKGKKMKDWIATARNFIRSDLEKNTVRKKNAQPGGLAPDAIKYLQDLAD